MQNTVFLRRGNVSLGSAHLLCQRCRSGVTKKGRMEDEDKRPGDHRGRGSVFPLLQQKDGEWQEFDICEACYDDWVKNFEVPVKTKEVTELI